MVYGGSVGERNFSVCVGHDLIKNNKLWYAVVNT